MVISSQKAFLESSPGRRAALAIVSLLLLPACVACFVAAHNVVATSDEGSPQGRFQLFFFGFVFEEFFGVSILFLTVLFFWACFRPAWAVRLLVFLGQRVGLAFFVIFGVIMLAAFTAALIQHLAK